MPGVGGESTARVVWFFVRKTDRERNRGSLNVGVRLAEEGIGGNGIIGPGAIGLLGDSTVFPPLYVIK